MICDSGYYMVLFTLVKLSCSFGQAVWQAQVRAFIQERRAESSVSARSQRDPLLGAVSQTQRSSRGQEVKTQVKCQQTPWVTNSNKCQPGTSTDRPSLYAPALSNSAATVTDPLCCPDLHFSHDLLWCEQPARKKLFGTSSEHLHNVLTLGILSEHICLSAGSICDY